MNDGGGPLILRGLDDVVAMAPHLVGAELAESIVVLPIHGRGAPVARIDMPQSADDAQRVAAQLAPVYERYDSPVVVLAYTAGRRDLAELACERLTEVLASSCPVVAAATVNGDRWVRLDQAEHGMVSTATRDRVTAEALWRRGSNPYPSLAEHRASFAAGPNLLSAQAITSARSHTESILADPQRLAEESAWVRLIVDRHVGTCTALPAPDAARLLADVQDVGLRDVAWACITRDEALRHGELWKDLLTRAPEGTEPPAASLAAFSFWVHGDGLSARVALERIPPDTHYSMAGILDFAVRNGLDPKAFPMPSEQPDLARAVATAPTHGQQRERRLPPRPTPPTPTPGVSR